MSAIGALATQYNCVTCYATLFCFAGWCCVSVGAGIQDGAIDSNFSMLHNFAEGQAHIDIPSGKHSKFDQASVSFSYS